MAPSVRPNSPARLAAAASAIRQTRRASAKLRPGMAKPQMPAAATTMRAAGEMSRASTAAEPTTRPPMMERLCPTDCGSETLASCSSSKAASSPSTSTMVGNGTARLLSKIDCSSSVGSICG